MAPFTNADVWSDEQRLAHTHTPSVQI